jgi:hypothetical protein
MQKEKTVEFEESAKRRGSELAETRTLQARLSQLLTG